MSISRLLAPSTAATSSFNLSCRARESLFCARWIRKTMMNVMMVVPVLMTSCQVSDQRKIGPLINQTMMVPAARQNAAVDPVQRVAQVANRSIMWGLRWQRPFHAGCQRLVAFIPREARDHQNDRDECACQSFP